ncbi:TetR/AcrR family transcriptional regulator [Deinococcus misasensis]|uniref:TetR/AcrR family transcriptional regulator n=1 Tax=Deinococcus misasensis TaxID=392413 RepID=UPI000555A42E|nr:TetR/AcrR family transcriptional regulator [Deinococcus misasensis]
MKTIRKDWFMAGMTLLATEGLRGLKMDTLCQSLQVTRGSFYHHFSSLDDYQQNLLDFYEQVTTLNIIEHLKTITDPKKRLRTLLEHITQYDPALEVAFRGWARVDERARAVQERIDQTRERYVQDLVSEILDGQDALKAQALYWLFLGSQQILQHDPAQKARVHLLVLEHLGL